MKFIDGWLDRKWQPPSADNAIADAMAITFGSEQGRAVLNYWMDTVYCTVCDSVDPQRVIAHNAQRALIHDLLQKLDQHAHPAKYEQRAPEVEEHDPRVN